MAGLGPDGPSLRPRAGLAPDGPCLGPTGSCLRPLAGLHKQQAQAGTCAALSNGHGQQVGPRKQQLDTCAALSNSGEVAGIRCSKLLSDGSGKGKGDEGACIPDWSGGNGSKSEGTWSRSSMEEMAEMNKELTLVERMWYMLMVTLQTFATSMRNALEKLQDNFTATIIDTGSWISTSNLFVKFAAVLSAGLPFIFMFGLIYHHMTGKPLKESIIKFYALINQLPGMYFLDEQSIPVFIFCNLVFWIGLFFFAVLLGVVAEEIKVAARNVRNGKFRVTQSDHLVVLNWNDQVPSMLRQLALGRKYSRDPFYRKPVAVLADKGKSDMDRAIASKLRGLELEVYTRTGSPAVVKDLQMVATQDAASVIVMQPDIPGASPVLMQAYLATSTMALAATMKPDSDKNVVLQSPVKEGKFVSAVESFNRLEGKLNRHVNLQMSDTDFIHRIVASSAAQPGLMRLYLDIFCPSAHGLLSKPLPPELVGRTFQDGRRMLKSGVVIGFIRDGKANMDPREYERLCEGDRIIVITSTLNTDGGESGKKSSGSSSDSNNYDFGIGSSFGGYGSSSSATVQASKETLRFLKHAASTAATWREEDQATCHLRSASPISMLIIGDISELAGPLSEVLPENSSATFIVPTLPEPQPPPEFKDGISLKLIAHSPPVGPQVLIDAGITTVDSVVVVVSGRNPHDADVMLATTVMQVQDAVCACGRHDAPYLIAPMHHYSTLKTVEAYLKSLRDTALARGLRPSSIITNMDLFIQEDMMAGVMVQSAADINFVEVITELLTMDEGRELYLREPTLYSVPLLRQISFGEVMEACRAFNETAIAIAFSDGSMMVAPSPFKQITLQEGDRIAVMGDEYSFHGVLSSFNQTMATYSLDPEQLPCIVEQDYEPDSTSTSCKAARTNSISLASDPTSASSNSSSSTSRSSCSATTSSNISSSTTTTSRSNVSASKNSSSTPTSGSNVSPPSPTNESDTSCSNTSTNITPSSSNAKGTTTTTSDSSTSCSDTSSTNITTSSSDGG